MAMTRDCKSLAFGLRRFESYLQHQNLTILLKNTDSFFKSSPTSSTTFYESALKSRVSVLASLEASPTSSTKICLLSSVGRAHPW